jgi:EmrB/QacA subfamily drug resistance transporter
VTTRTSQTRPRSAAWVLGVAAIAALMAALDAMVVSTALTTIRLDLGASIEQLEWTVNAYNLTLAVLLLPAAALGDRFGRRRRFTVGLALFVAASAACALAPDAGSLIAARAFQGAGAALVIPNALALVSAAFPAERRGSALGILQGITGLAVVAGPVIGGAVAEGIDWEWIFWLNVPIGLAAIPLALAHIEESIGGDTALDIGGFALVTGGALGVVWGLVRGNSAGWDSPEVVAALALGAALLAAFVAWELRAREPMLPMRFFRSRAFSSGNAAVFFLFASLFGAVFFLAQFLQTGLGNSPLEAALRLGPWTGTLFVVAPIAGALADRIGERPRSSSAGSRSRPPGWAGSR